MNNFVFGYLIKNGQQILACHCMRLLQYQSLRFLTLQKNTFLVLVYLILEVLEVCSTFKNTWNGKKSIPWLKCLEYEDCFFFGFFVFFPTRKGRNLCGYCLGWDFVRNWAYLKKMWIEKSWTFILCNIFLEMLHTSIASKFSV